MNISDYIADYPGNCALSVPRTQGVLMLKQKKKPLVIIGPDSNSKFAFQDKNNPQEHCGKPTPSYPTNDGKYKPRL